ncbi:MAG: hypothetical protein NC087_07505 [Anaeroplasma bactoclasticum]|nr:hypothetical protein [Anaeroplasma bactoclasticum]MCM1557365.1 hypothetical protein [Anaeroplasma bactoclasticum]
MAKNKDFSRLTKLYLSYHLNKMTLILLGIVLLLWTVVLILNAGIPLEMESYVVSSKNYHLSYLEQSLFFLEIIDGVFVAFLVGAELSSFSLFDPMFVPNISRIKIILCKLLANIILLIFILAFQIILLFFIGVLSYPSFMIGYKDLLLIFYMALPMIELLLLGELLSILINSYFIPILIFILHILVVILFRKEEIRQNLYIYLPQIEIIGNQITLNGNLLIYSGICLLLLIGIILIFQKKDIKSI